MRSGKGQAFVIGSLIFSTLLILLFLATGPSILGSKTNANKFFSQTLEESTDIMNDAMRDNRSIGHTKRRMYSYNQFLERKSKEKGIKYRSYDLIVLPGKGDAAFINYYKHELDAKLWIDGSWTNITVSPEQSFETSFPTGKVSIKLIVQGEGSHSFDAVSPRLVKHSIMESEDENWENTLLG